MNLRRLWIEAAICCVGTSAFMHMVPLSYLVRQDYELFGTINKEADLPQDLTAAIRSKVPNENALKRLKCTPASTPTQLTCSLPAQQRSEAAHLSKVLRDVAPSRVGWIQKDLLQARLKDTETQMRLWSSDLAALETELRTLETKLPESEKLLAKETARKAGLENDLANKKTQLNLLEEGMANRSPDDQERFKAKRAEVSQTVSQLQVGLDAADKNLLALVQPLERRKTILEALPKLRAQIDLARAQIASWPTLLKSAAEAPTVADPGHFQLAALPSKKNILPIRGWGHLPWSLLLGFLIFGAIRRKQLSDWKERYFDTPQEVTQETGLPCLGTL